MNMFIGWWHETGLALFACALRSSAVSALHPSDIATPRPEGAHAVILVDFRTEDQDMRNTLQVRWTITPTIAPQPWIACSGCGGLRAFQSSDKIRLNANGRKLDAWLIYRCTGCDRTWNRPIFERRNVRDIKPAVLDALQRNDPEWIRAETFNLDVLKRKSARVDEFSEIEVRKDVLSGEPDWTRLAIGLVVPVPTSIRLDRLLASELGISRSRLQFFNDDGMLRVNPDRSEWLRRRICDGLEVTLDLRGEKEAEAIRMSAAGGGGPPS